LKVCPKCKTAKNIVKSYYSEENGKLYKVLVYACRNPECEEFGKEEKVKQEIEVQRGE
jgi:hypothetical protein